MLTAQQTTALSVRIRRLTDMTAEQRDGLSEGEVEAIRKDAIAARNEMVLQNEGLVKKIVQSFLQYGVEFDELYQEGMDGLIHACELYRPSESKFSTYASFWIKERIREFLRNQPLVRTASHMIDTLNKFRKARQALAEEVGSGYVCIEYVFERLNIKKEKKKRMVYQAIISRSNYQPVEDWNVSTGEEEEERSSVDLSVLDNECEREILMHRFGFYGGKPKTLQETGKMLGVSREWVRKKQEEALFKLRKVYCEQEDNYGSVDYKTRAS
jgi:RNA polymerase sigma factor (sigma-70 family)